MKTHVVKENRILKSFDSVLIVLTMSFVTFMILKSTVLLGDLKKHSITDESIKFEFPVMPQHGNAVNAEKSATLESGSASAMSNVVTSIKEIEVKATKVEQPAKIMEKSKDVENAPAVDVQFEKSVLENWINDRDAWEQK